MLLTNKKKNNNTWITERPNSALAILQQNARKMNILRSSLEPRMNFIVSYKENAEDYQELAWVLELVKKGELVLKAISDRKELCQYLEEFITIFNNAALSMGDVGNDVDDTMVVAGALLSQLRDAISKVPTGALPDSRHEIEPSLLDELSTILAAGKADAPKESSVTSVLEKKKEGEGEEGQEQAKSVVA